MGRPWFYFESGLSGVLAVSGLSSVSGLSGLVGLSGLAGLSGLSGLSALACLSGLSGVAERGPYYRAQCTYAYIYINIYRLNTHIRIITYTCTHTHILQGYARNAWFGAAQI